MNILIPEGLKEAAMTWALFVWKFFTFELFGLMSIPMGMWDYKDNVAHRIAGKKSYFSKSGIAIVAATDSKHPGRFRVYAICLDGDAERIEFIKYIYNDRKYSYKISRRLNNWYIMVDGVNIMMETDGMPMMVHNLLPKLSQKLSIEKDIEITL